MLVNRAERVALWYLDTEKMKLFAHFFVVTMFELVGTTIPYNRRSYSAAEKNELAGNIREVI